MCSSDLKEFTLETLGPELKELASLDPEEGVVPPGGKPLSSREIMIRADRNAPYGYIQAVIEKYAGTADTTKPTPAGAGAGSSSVTGRSQQGMPHARHAASRHA